VQQIVGKKTTGATANDYKRKSIESWVWRKHLAICRGYKTQTAFLNLQKWLLNAQEVWHSTNTAPAMVHGQPEYPCFNLTTLHRDDILYPSSRD
jgi:hypothetical protein